MPGVKKEDIDVAIEGNQVTITAEVKQEWEKKEGDRMLRNERYFGNVYRSFTLPAELDESACPKRGLSEEGAPYSTSAITFNVRR